MFFMKIVVIEINNSIINSNGKYKYSDRCHCIYEWNVRHDALQFKISCKKTEKNV